MTLLASAYIDGFDPSAPMRYAESNFLTQVVLTGMFIAATAIVIFFVADDRLLWKLRNSIALSVASFVVMSAIALPIIVGTSDIYNAEAAAAKWAHDRYGVDMADYDVKSLINGFSSGSSTSTVMLDDGQKITGRKISGKIILVKRGSGNPNSEMDVVYGGAN